MVLYRSQAQDRTFTLDNEDSQVVVNDHQRTQRVTENDLLNAYLTLHLAIRETSFQTRTEPSLEETRQYVSSHINRYFRQRADKTTRRREEENDIWARERVLVRDRATDGEQDGPRRGEYLDSCLDDRAKIVPFVRAIRVAEQQGVSCSLNGAILLVEGGKVNLTGNIGIYFGKRTELEYINNRIRKRIEEREYEFVKRRAQLQADLEAQLDSHVTYLGLRMLLDDVKNNLQGLKVANERTFSSSLTAAFTGLDEINRYSIGEEQKQGVEQLKAVLRTKVLHYMLSPYYSFMQRDRTPDGTNTAATRTPLPTRRGGAPLPARTSTATSTRGGANEAEDLLRDFLQTDLGDGGVKRKELSQAGVDALLKAYLTE